MLTRHSSQHIYEEVTIHSRSSKYLSAQIVSNLCIMYKGCNNWLTNVPNKTNVVINHPNSSIRYAERILQDDTLLTKWMRSKKGVFEHKVHCDTL